MSIAECIFYDASSEKCVHPGADHKLPPWMVARLVLSESYDPATENGRLDYFKQVCLPRESELDKRGLVVFKRVVERLDSIFDAQDGRQRRELATELEQETHASAQYNPPSNLFKEWLPLVDENGGCIAIAKGESPETFGCITFRRPTVPRFFDARYKHTIELVVDARGKQLLLYWLDSKLQKST